ncbi:MAG: gamma-glutamyltransferase family protein [Gammaproteobacteria bacterium]|nr:gamma-glutamyltransferase family protein [Gammaproteobacteria bacterium]
MYWEFPYPSRRVPVCARNVVATSQPLAAQAGLNVLRQGGNAVDAALASAITLTVVEPTSNGIGSDAFAIVWDGSELHGFNGSGRSPRAWSEDRFAACEAITVGWDSVTVPGAVDTWRQLSERFGRMAFDALFDSAIDYARTGFVVTPTIAGQWREAVDGYRDFPDFLAAFLRDGRAPLPGEIFRFPEQAATLQSIAETRGDALYRGPLGDALVAHARRQGGVMERADLESHRGEWVDLLTQSYRDIDVYEIPPNGQGVAVLIALGILTHVRLEEYPLDGADSIHLQIEAMKLAFRDLQAHIADPAHMRLAPEDLLDTQRLAALAGGIDVKRASAMAVPVIDDGGTVYLSTADDSGMMVSYIQSNYWGFGSGVVIPGTGISLQNRGAGFNLTHGHPNCVAGGKRPLHTIIPGFVRRGGQPLLAFGVMGGHMQAQGHVQMCVRLFDHGQNPQAAADGPRWFVDTRGAVALESGLACTIGPDLAARGHALATPAPVSLFGGAQLIQRLDNGYYCAGSDPRKDGQAVGY